MKLYNSKLILLILFSIFLFQIECSNYTYYLLAVQKWCSKEYKIHGLWPQYNETSYPEFCIDVKYKNPNPILVKELNKYWSSCGDNSKLWKHEWLKHGSCINQQFNVNENEYLNFTLNIYKNNIDLIKHCDKKHKDCILGCFNIQGNRIAC